MFILKVCDNSSMLNTILFIKNLINIIFIVVPLVLALLFSIDLAKNVFAKDDKNNLKLGIKRIIYSVVLMFVPLIVEAFMSMISDYSKVAKCYDIATEQKVQELYQKEEDEYEKQQEALRKAQEEQKDKVSKENQAEQKAAKEAEQTARLVQAEIAKNRMNSSSNASSANIDLSGAKTGAEKIARTAEQLAWPRGTSKSKLSYPYGRKTSIRSWKKLTKGKPTKAFMEAMDRVYPDHFKWPTGYPAIRPGGSCDTFVGVTVKASGYDTLGKTMGQIEGSLKRHKTKWKRVSKAKRGDVCIDSHHIKIYLGNGKIAQASYAGFFGRIDKGGCSSSVKIYRAKK